MGRFLHLGLEQPETRHQRVERRAPCQRRDRGAERVLTRALELAVRAAQRLTVGLRVGQQLRLGLEPVVLLAVRHGGRVDLLELVAQQVDLPRPRPLVTAE